MNKEKDLFEKTFDELWKTEEYNFGTTDEDGWHNFDDYTEYPFAIEEMETLANEYNKIKQQLQAYKDKEDKLKVELENFHTQFEIDETIPSHNLKTKKEILAISRQRIKNCLQILNEGSDGNE